MSEPPQQQQDESLQQQQPMTASRFFGADSILEFPQGINTTFARGAFGEISVAVYRDPTTTTTTTSNTGAPPPPRWAAVKTVVQATTTSGLKQQQRRLHADVDQEVHALDSLRAHPNIISLLALYCPPPSSSMPGVLCMALEYCPTDLHVTLEWRRRLLLPLLSMEVIQWMAQDLFAALCHCHSLGWVHGDIKPGNLLVSSTGVIKLCDFGLARRIAVPDGTTSDTSVASSSNNNSEADAMPRGLCTLAYRPPELLLNSSTAVTHAAAGDLWSAGVVLAELLTGKTLFPGTNDLSQMTLLVQSLGAPSDSFLESLQSPHCQELLRSTAALSSSHPTNHDQALSSLDWIHRRLPRAVETPALLDLLRNSLLVWDPRQRPVSAPAAVRQHVWLERKDPSPLLQQRQALLEQVLPPALDEPFLLLQPLKRDDSSQSSTTDGVLSNIEEHQQQAMAMAKTRRTFLRDLDVWQEE